MNEITLLQKFVHDHSGIVIPTEKSYLFETRLSKLMAETGSETLGDFYNSVLINPNPSTIQRVINVMTTNETLWFRDSTPWKILEISVLPRILAEFQSGIREKARIWSAAVSTGQEAYSTVMCVDDFLSRHRSSGVSLDNFEFFATDISTGVLNIAKKGRYDAISIKRGLSDYYREKYFTFDGSAYDLSPKIRNAVRFMRFNLKDSFGCFGRFDIIFCRYVLIYFNDELQRDVIARMGRAICENGVLFTGNYSLYNQFETEYNIHHYKNSKYYSKKAGLR